MNLRHKKPINSYKGQASYQDQKIFQRQARRTYKNKIEEYLGSNKAQAHLIQNRKSLSQLLASFINNSNYAFKMHSQKRTAIVENSDLSTDGKKHIKKNRKRSEHSESFEQKKIEVNLYYGKQGQISQNKTEKDSRNSSNFHKKNLQNLDGVQVSTHQNAQFQNIINQNNNSNIFNYLPNFQQSFNFPLIAHQIPQFLYYNYPQNFGSSLSSRTMNVPGFSLYDQMRNGLMRQMQIYELYKKNYDRQPNLKDMETNIPKDGPVKAHKKNVQNSHTEKPEKIMKRASYHVGIAYMIYLDKIKKSGVQIKSIQAIDPTKQAKKFKQNHHKNI